MASSIDKSLDEIIEEIDEGKWTSRGLFGRGGSTSETTSGGGPIKHQRGNFGFSPYPRKGNKMDMEGSFKRQRQGDGMLVLSNLDYGVTSKDIMELFSEFGKLKSAKVNYDETGRSQGSAIVVFEQALDALKAMEKYNGVSLDGRPMRICFSTSDIGQISMRIGKKPAHGGNGPFRGSGFKRGRGNGRDQNGKKRETPTVEDLDAELEAYIQAGKV